eukprot:1953117-Alexandrium_andersonii.AAC.1
MLLFRAKASQSCCRYMVNLQSIVRTLTAESRSGPESSGASSSTGAPAAAAPSAAIQRRLEEGLDRIEAESKDAGRCLLCQLPAM